LPYKDPIKNKECIAKWKKDHPEVAKARRLRHRLILHRLKLEQGCQHCGYDKHPVALEFHHVNPSNKSFELNNINIGLMKLLRETEKCIVLCSNCHRIEEYRLNKNALY
jgi:5-methylcytosine-specific restriction endonuclease McrA